MILLVNHSYHVRQVIKEFHETNNSCRTVIDEKELIEIIYEKIFSELPLRRVGNNLVSCDINPDDYLKEKMFIHFVGRAHGAVDWDNNNPGDAIDIMHYGMFGTLNELLSLKDLVNYAFKYGTETLLGFQTDSEPHIQVLEVHSNTGSVLIDVDYDAWS